MFLNSLKKLILIFLFSIQAGASDFFNDLGKTFTGAFDEEGLIILGVGAGATAFAFSQDQAVHDAWVNHQRMSSDISHVGDIAGTGLLQISIAGAQLIWDKKNGLTHTEALIASTIVTYGLKYGTQRPRPESNNRTSFPSGHTQISFVTATSLTHSYGLKAAIPLYSLAIVTGLSRLADNAHWFSDVVAGATIGILFARSAAKLNAIITPVTMDRGYGLQLTYTF